MAIDFPNNPNNGDTHTVGDIVWVWNSTKNVWEFDPYDGPRDYVICSSTNRPASPYEGLMIFENDTDTTLVYDGSNWKQIYPAVWG